MKKMNRKKKEVHITKQIPYLDTLNILVLESIKIYWRLLAYFSMKI